MSPTRKPRRSPQPSESGYPSLYPTYTYSEPPDPSYTVPTPSAFPSQETIPPPPPRRSPKPSYSSTPHPKSEKPTPSPKHPDASPSPSPTAVVLTLVPMPSHIEDPAPSYIPDYPVSPTPSPGGLSGDPCDPNVPKSCKDYRECSRRKTCESQDCNGVCIWSTLCTCTSDCYHGEICVSSASDDKFRFCYSPFRVVDIPWVKVHHCAESGMTGDGCIDDTYCKGGRKCVQGGRSECLHGLSQCGLDRPACDSTAPFDCYCSGVRFCTCKEGCEDSEVCCDTPYGNVCLSRNSVAQNVTLLQCPVTVDAREPTLVDDGDDYEDDGNQSNSTTTMHRAPPGKLYAIGDPLNEAQSPSPSPFGAPITVQDGNNGPGTQTGSDPGTGSSSTETVQPVSTVCVDARALAHLPREALVFPQHVRSAVLCDTYGSCATPGHMITFHGRPMMMTSYCALERCTRRVMFVNSPKYRRRLTIDSKTEHLKFTALAARYESATEELVLSTAVHIGL